MTGRGWEEARERGRRVHRARKGRGGRAGVRAQVGGCEVQRWVPLVGLDWGVDGRLISGNEGYGGSKLSDSEKRGLHS